MKAPLKSLLGDGMTEERVQRLWRATSAGLLRPRHPLRLPFVLAVVGAAACALAVVLWTTHLAPAPLTLADGAPLVALSVEDRRELTFTDGSQLTLWPATQLSVQANEVAVLHLGLERGRARFAVVPGGPRRWRVDAGVVTIEVVGTVFEVQRDGGRVSVAVERGIVRVSGAGVPAGETLLTAGSSLTLGAVEKADPPALPTPAPESEHKSPQHSAAPWTTLAQRGEHARAWDVLGDRGLREAARRAGAKDLMLLADVARLSGHPEAAVGPLEQLLANDAAAPEARLAAIILGRLELGPLQRPSHAARAFERALEIGVPASFDEEVRASLAIALGRAGELARASEAAEQYFVLHPRGTRAAQVEAWRSAH